MPFESSHSELAATQFPTNLDRTRVGAIGDDTIATLPPSPRSSDPSLLDALSDLRPDIAIDESTAVAIGGGTTVAVADVLSQIIALDRKPHILLISAGTEDCRQTTTGTAPPMAESRASLSKIADTLLILGVTPIFIVPPPSPMFVNGLFADRFIAIAATLRQLATRPRVGLIDATSALMKTRAYGVEPDPAFVDADGRLTSKGRQKLAEVAATIVPGVNVMPSASTHRRPS